MPVRGGYDAIRRIKADPKLKATPIIAVGLLSPCGATRLRPTPPAATTTSPNPTAPPQLVRTILSVFGEQG